MVVLGRVMQTLVTSYAVILGCYVTPSVVIPSGAKATLDQLSRATATAVMPSVAFQSRATPATLVTLTVLVLPRLSHCQHQTVVTWTRFGGTTLRLRHCRPTVAALTQFGGTNHRRTTTVVRWFGGTNRCHPTTVAA